MGAFVQIDEISGIFEVAFGVNVGFGLLSDLHRSGFSPLERRLANLQQRATSQPTPVLAKTHIRSANMEIYRASKEFEQFMANLVPVLFGLAALCAFVMFLPLFGFSELHRTVAFFLSFLVSTPLPAAYTAKWYKLRRRRKAIVRLLDKADAMLRASRGNGSAPAPPV